MNGLGLLSAKRVSFARHVGVLRTRANVFLPPSRRSSRACGGFGPGGAGGEAGGRRRAWGGGGTGRGGGGGPPTTRGPGGTCAPHSWGRPKPRGGAPPP